MKKYNDQFVQKIDVLGVRQANIRFLLTVHTKAESGRTILVIMKNPSKANKFQSDKSVNNVIKRLSSYKTIYIANLFPYYSTKAPGLLSYFDDEDDPFIQQINQTVIERCIEEVDDILIGWGTNTIGMKQVLYDAVISDVMDMLLKSNKPLYYVHCCACKKYACKQTFPKCNNRCSLKCKRNNKVSGLVCGKIRYPMHLELWDKQKTIQRY